MKIVGTVEELSLPKTYTSRDGRKGIYWRVKVDEEWYSIFSRNIRNNIKPGKRYIFTIDEDAIIRGVRTPDEETGEAEAGVNTNEFTTKTTEVKGEVEEVQKVPPLTPGQQKKIAIKTAQIALEQKKLEESGKRDFAMLLSYAKDIAVAYAQIKGEKGEVLSPSQIAVETKLAFSILVKVWEEIPAIIVQSRDE